MYLVVLAQIMDDTPIALVDTLQQARKVAADVVIDGPRAMWESSPVCVRAYKIGKRSSDGVRKCEWYGVLRHFEDDERAPEAKRVPTARAARKPAKKRLKQRSLLG